jgi:hypothetical protein
MEWSAVLSAFFGAALGVLAALVTAVFVEPLRTRIAAAYWEAQQRWTLKREIYTRLLDALHELVEVRDPYTGFRQQELAYDRDPGAAPPGWDERAARVNEGLRQRERAAWSAIHQGMGSARLLVGKTTEKALRELDEDLKASEHEITFHQALEHAYAEVLKSAAVDLKLRAG